MNRQGGVTLIELMIVVAVIGILSAIAVPAYSSYIARGKIAQGIQALSEAKVRMEQNFNSMRTYASAAGGTECPAQLFTTLFSDTPFSVSLSNCSDSTYTVTATGLSAQSMSGYIYTINQSGDKTSKTPAVSTTQNCWLKTKDQTSC